jgi:hypothetical protein
VTSKSDFEFQQDLKTTLNDIFKQVVVTRDWRTHVTQVLELLQNEKEDLQLSNAFIEIMTKIMIIPAQQSKSAQELISIYVKFYEQMLKPG